METFLIMLALLLLPLYAGWKAPVHQSCDDTPKAKTKKPQRREENWDD